MMWPFELWFSQLHNETTVNLVYAWLCLLAASGASERRVMLFSSVLYLWLALIG